MVLVSSDGVQYPGHKVILANHSLFFQELFSSTSDNRLNLEDLNSSNLEDLLNYLYGGPTGASVLSSKNVKPLTEAARKYQMPQLLKASDEFCAREVAAALELDSSSVLSWLAFALEYELPAFKRECKKFLDENVSDTINSFMCKIKEGSSVDNKALSHLLDSAQNKLHEAKNAKETLQWMVSASHGNKDGWDGIISMSRVLADFSPWAERVEDVVSWLKK